MALIVLAVLMDNRSEVRDVAVVAVAIDSDCIEFEVLKIVILLRRSCSGVLK